MFEKASTILSSPKRIRQQLVLDSLNSLSPDCFYVAESNYVLLDRNTGISKSIGYGLFAKKDFLPCVFKIS